MVSIVNDLEINELMWIEILRTLPTDGGCNKRTVQAILVGKRLGKMCLLGIGISGPRHGLCTWIGKGKCTSCEHAEWRCVLSAIDYGPGDTLYITREPCTDMPCRALLDRFGIDVVVVS